MAKKKIAIICGGITDERGISLNSARSLYDSFDRSKYELSLFYFNPQLEAYEITPAQVYSNTPLDFDYILKHKGQSLNEAELSEKLRATDLAFPAIHGLFGEDGQLQTLLEKYKVKYVGSGPEACQQTSDKHQCQQILKKHGFYTKENWVVKKGEIIPDLPIGKYVAKPLHGGSSIGVEYIEKPVDTIKAVEKVWQVEDEAIIEPWCEGREFTIIVLENDRQAPVALLPTEIEFSRVNITFDRFFSYRKKYLPTTEIRYHTPARFKSAEITKIREESARAFQVLGMKGFARIDGWLLEDGTIWLSDINAINGMEQNSFLFQQAAVLGMSHTQLLD
ncbi:MAG: ATP-grasp domain-containing protein, partial [Parcubacteria group bacterium]